MNKIISIIRLIGGGLKRKQNNLDYSKGVRIEGTPFTIMKREEEGQKNTEIIIANMVVYRVKTVKQAMKIINSQNWQMLINSVIAYWDITKSINEKLKENDNN